MALAIGNHHFAELALGNHFVVLGFVALVLGIRHFAVQVLDSHLAVRLVY